MFDLEASEDIIKNPSKRQLQQFLFSRIVNNSMRYKESLRILCLPGVSGWDTEYFSRLKKKTEVIGLEAEKTYAENLQLRYADNPKVKIINTTILEYFAVAEKHSLDLIYLDYFSNFNFAMKLDIETLIRREVLAPQGKLIVNFYGARETLADTYYNKLIYEEFCARFDKPAQHTGTENIRAAAYVAFIFGLRKKYRAGLTSPTFAKYESNSAYMYTSWCTYNGKSVTMSNEAVLKAGGKWFLTGAHEKIKEFKADRYMPAHSLRGDKRLYQDSYVKNLAKKFYADKGYTPTRRELRKHCKFLSPSSFQSVKYNKALREAGLCPRVHATQDELIGEIKRLYLKWGFISWGLLVACKLYRRLLYIPNYNQVLKDNDIDLWVPQKIGPKIVMLILKDKLVREYLEHLDAGKKYTEYKHYKFLFEHKLTTSDKCAAFCREFERTSKLENFAEHKVYGPLLKSSLENLPRKHLKLLNVRILRSTDQYGRFSKAEYV